MFCSVVPGRRGDGDLSMYKKKGPGDFFLQDNNLGC